MKIWNKSEHLCDHEMFSNGEEVLTTYLSNVTTRKPFSFQQMCCFLQALKDRLHN